MFIRRLNLFFSWIFFFCVLCGRSIDSAVQASSPRLVYVYTKSLTPVWNDRGTNAEKSFTIWKPTDKKGTFLALGDVIESYYNFPNKDVMMVLDKGDGLVVPPDSFTKLWQDSGSGSKTDVAIYKMNTRPGYTCIGHVAVASYSSLPDKSKYRCLKNELLTPGYQEELVWSTKRSKASWKNSFWTVSPKEANSQGIETGLFLVGNGESSPSQEQPYVVLSSKAVFWEFAYKPSQPSIVLYQTSDVDLIWDDNESGGKFDASIWRVKECCSLGDMAASDYNQMVGFVAKEMIPGTLSKPTGFKQIWYNLKAKGRKIAIWKPTCLTNYVALGHVATPDTYNMPNVEESNFRCVHSKIVDENGKWTKIWTDAGTGSKIDGTFFIAEATSSATTDVSAMTAVDGYRNPTGAANVLKSDNVQMRYSKRIKSIEVINAAYDLDKKKEIYNPNDKRSLSADIQYIKNCKATSKDDPDLYGKVILSYTETRELTWRHDLTVEVGVSVGFTVDIPFVGETSVDVSVKVAKTESRETKATSSVTKTREAASTMKPKKKGGFYVEGKERVYEIPWTGTAVYTYVDGSKREEPIGGVYRDVQASEGTIVAMPTEDC